MVQEWRKREVDRPHAKTEATVVAIPSRRDRIQPPSAKLDRSRRIPARNNVESSGSCCRSTDGRLARSSILTTCVPAKVVPSVTSGKIER